MAQKGMKTLQKRYARETKRALDSIAGEWRLILQHVYDQGVTHGVELCAAAMTSDKAQKKVKRGKR